MNKLEKCPVEEISYSTLCYHQEKKGYEPFPEWAKAFINIGEASAKLKVSEFRSVIALTVPVRTYAAVLIAVGIVKHRSLQSTGSNDPNEYFARLCGLPSLTKIWLSDGQKRYKGIILGTESVGGQHVLKIQRFDSIHYVGAQNASNVEIENWAGELAMDTRGKRIVRRVDFLDAVYDGAIPKDFGTKSRLDAVIVGSVARLQTEIVNTQICVKLPTGHSIDGKFQDLLRTRRIAPDRPFRSELVSDISPDLDCKLRTEDSVVIFDGARAFINQRDEFKACTRIVVLDRTTQSFQDAVDILNQQYVNRVTEFPRFQNTPGIPWGMELMAFEERIS